MPWELKSPPASWGRFKIKKETIMSNKNSDLTQWAIPYVDQPPEFWERLSGQLGEHIREVYFPISSKIIGSGRPMQPEFHLKAFLNSGHFKGAVLINPIVLSAPVEYFIDPIIQELDFLLEHYPISGITVSNLDLAKWIHGNYPDVPLTASILMDIHKPIQVEMLGDVFDCLVPSSRIMRDVTALRQIREAFKGKIRLIVNEACISGCPYRVQHFYEMCSDNMISRALCDSMLRDMPWLRLTGAWVLPQHLHLYEGVYDELKLAGRATLQDPEKYFKVLNAYITGEPLAPNEIGGGPAAVLEPIDVDENFYSHTMSCANQCHKCDMCRRYYDNFKNH
jgi:collagenase-like PrtC family protease